ncbi:MAG TPA: FtsX-like permease family protein, partial [Gemmatimonadaceae bacterium]|nr:FtsX-like permease family protein [Gemmatimonadaceae bacterium]
MDDGSRGVAMKAIGIWFSGLVRRRYGRMLPAVLGVALTIALLSILGIFINASAATMTRRAVADVPIDWQIDLTRGANMDSVVQQLNETVTMRAMDSVGYADVDGFTARSGGNTLGGTTQTTGAGKILGVTSTYWNDFPGLLRPMLGATEGILIAQQTAANLHVSVGDTITISRVDSAVKLPRMGLPPLTVRIDGIVDLPQADALFQAIGVPPGAAPQAPPDNVLIVPMDVWHKWFDQQAIVLPGSVRTQLHVRLAHTLPDDPRDAYVYVEQLAHKFEARVVGSALVANNLAARLDAVREDALYARVLFLFLGLPGAVLAIILTFAVSATGGDRRRREQALLRVRGATTSTILRLESLEAIVVSFLAAILALIIALIVVSQMV